MNSTDEEIKLLYLLSGSCDVLPASYLKLRSYLNIHTSNIADQQNLQLLKSFRNRNKTCPYCYSSWSGDTTSFKLLPAKRSRTCKRQSELNEDGKNETPEKKESRNTLVLRCKVCTKKSSFSLVRRKPVEEKVKEDNAESIKKKKKKRDKSCGLAVNLIKPEKNSPEIIVLKKKKSMEGVEKTKSEKPAHPQDIHSKVSPKSAPIPKSLVSGKNLVPNPFAAKTQLGFSQKKKDKKLERLKQAVKVEKSLPKKSIKDFLTLV